LAKHVHLPSIVQPHQVLRTGVQIERWIDLCALGDGQRHYEDDERQ
jgi:hypothetical protein